MTWAIGEKNMKRIVWKNYFLREKTPLATNGGRSVSIAQKSSLYFENTLAVRPVGYGEDQGVGL